VKNFLAPVAALAISAGALAAQTPTQPAPASSVGHTPNTSPYVDLEYNQELSLLGGYNHAHRDAANVGPQSGLALGLKYEYRATGPLYLITELSRFSSERNVIDPTKSGAARDLGTKTRALYTADAGLGLGLTGGKSWHHIAPVLESGVGLITDLQSAPEPGGFKFGTRFAFTWGGGVRILPGGRWAIRGDVKNRLYTMAYPEAYFTTPTGGTPVVPGTQAKSFWLNNPTFTLGLSRLF
jgi:opacity protein-like surface antigen